MTTNYTYRDFYTRLIEKARHGFKAVPGGTGIGKTAGIAETIRHDEGGRKFIYCTNRIQLLDEMAHELRGDASDPPITRVAFSHLRSNREILQKLLNDPSDRNRYFEFLASPRIQRLCESASQRLKSRFDPRYIRHLSEEIQHAPLYSSDLMDELLEGRIRRIIKFWRTLIRSTLDKDGEPTAEWRFLIEQPVIGQLFPYIPFKYNPQVSALLVTMQKFYRGFFDGRRMVSLFNLTEDDDNCIIFMDEFDFLETNLIDLLCEDTKIEAPFHFVEQFYRTLKRDRLPLPSYPEKRAWLRARLDAIIEQIERLPKQGINFPQLMQFVGRGALKETPAIFQTSRTILTEPLSLREGSRAWQVLRVSPTTGTLDALELLHAIHEITYQILVLFKTLELKDQTAYQELGHHCFAHTGFQELLPKLHQLPQAPGIHTTGFDALLANGYGVFELRDLQQETDPDEIEWRYQSLFTTPEAILAALAKDNLVFGLSATALLPRYIANFNMDWLRSQQGVTVHQLDEQDQSIINYLNTEKQARRQNQLIVERTNGLSREQPGHALLLESIRALATYSGFGGDDPRGFRRKRVEHFFETLEWIAHQPAHSRPATHLLFFNSYHQIEFIFKDHPKSEDTPPLWLITKRDNPTNDLKTNFSYYEIEFGGTSFIVIFYNAKNAQTVAQSETAQAHFNKAFWEDKPVILVTTYPSAGNGVNLQYRPSADSSDLTDFQSIHLLDAPYHYFSPLPKASLPEEYDSVLRKNIWYLAKLYEAKLLSEAEFRQRLTLIRTSNLNEFYHRDPYVSVDAHHNKIATFVQALGRIERVWHHVPNQTVRMSNEVWANFAIFCTQSAYEQTRELIYPYLSANLKSVLQQLPGQVALVRRAERELRDERLPEQQDKSQVAIHKLLERLAVLRAGRADATIRDEWQILRQSVLRHDFQHDSLRNNNAVFQSDYVKEGVLHLTTQGYLLPSDVVAIDSRRWDLNLLYAVVKENKVMREHFEKSGYELAFRYGGRFIFTPYCYQAILQGAVGEEAIYAILQQENIGLEPLADTVFEIADLKMARRPWYIDCKNFSERTLEIFSLPESDYAWHPQLNDDAFKENAQRKLNTLRSFHVQQAEACKLIYLNLTSSDAWKRHYLNAEFEPVDRFEEATIVVVPGVVLRDDPDTYTEAFRKLLPYLRPTHS